MKWLTVCEKNWATDAGVTGRQCLAEMTGKEGHEIVAQGPNQITDLHLLALAAKN